MKRIAIVGILVLALLAGCSKPGIVGKWKVDPAFVTKNASSPGMQPGYMTGFASTFTYDFKADKTFTGSMSEGTYTFDGSKVEVTTTKLGGQDVSQLNGGKPQMTGELSSDGKTLTLHPMATGMLPAALQGGIPMVRDGG